MKYWVILFFLMYFNAYSQQEGPMETDRPDQTECPYIVKKGYIQAEMGFNLNKELPNPNFNLPSTLWKYGLAKWIELRYVNNLLLDSSLHFKQEAIGFKVKLWDKKRYLPLTSLIVHYNLRDEKRDVSDKNYVPHSIGQAILTFQHPIFKQLGMGYNFGYEFHEDGTKEGIYRISPGLTFKKNWYAYAEIFGRFPVSEATDHWFDGGIAHYFNDDLKVDFSAGKSFFTDSEWYLALGLSFRFKVKK